MANEEAEKAYKYHCVRCGWKGNRYHTGDDVHGLKVCPKCKICTVSSPDYEKGYKAGYLAGQQAKEDKIRKELKSNMSVTKADYIIGYENEIKELKSKITGRKSNGEK